ncbi:hypothetical protein IB75_09480 [Nitrosococcus oceani C-27]|uniref:Uncharacterized protein n=1 Tax=Nitrosococcus oceani C-27 TaxID=314279 RepID=A0A0E2Z1I5_9GAMM|nr:hypothetical protein IB75_09480 [Nitrosococcus oceani C-27]
MGPLWAWPPAALIVSILSAMGLTAGREAGKESHAAVHEQSRAGDVIRGIGAEPDHRSGDVIWLADSFVGHQLHQISIGFRRAPGGSIDRRANAPGPMPLTRMRSGASTRSSRA